MNFKKRFVALCLIVTAALSLTLSVPAKCTKSEQTLLLCESYQEDAVKRC